MTEYDFELECTAFLEIDNVLHGRQKAGPSTGFMDALQTLIDTQGVHVAGTPKEAEVAVTPEEMGWTT